ncbi:hypothetical protein phiPsa347_034 [Pseudomonas phage phiPsa347]|uniref:Uncharacterized protein n=1 Tax=Pseudomonas phage phiPsa347 TaxID=1460364 RepID=A0A7G9V2K4_9CAUD|nr:hypothetical protein QGX18_gp034 [Pseudomonas phage phiPsa347]QNO00510.1 hypothetical protein phiPsa347_034 [Pseudomonas phage phiPsa347]
MNQLERVKAFRDELAGTLAFSGDVEYGYIAACLPPLNKYVEEMERVKSLLDSRATGIGKIDFRGNNIGRP